MPPSDEPVSYRVKAVLLSILALQNAVLMLTARWSRVIAETEPGPQCAKTTVIVCCECLKMAVAFALTIKEESGAVLFALRKVYCLTLEQFADFAKSLIPSALYVLQNNLLLVGADNLDGPVLSVLTQFKIFTTALFSILLLKRRLDARQWMALFVLGCGVSFVQLSQMEINRGESDVVHRYQFLGSVAVLGSCCTSGVAGVYFEKVLKDSNVSVWVRNTHLAAFGIVAGMIAMLASEAESVVKNGFFSGYNAVVGAYIVVQAGGGLLVAVVIKYTDNILKSFASSAAIVITCVVSTVFFGFHANNMFLAGATAVVYSIFLYGDLVRDCPLCQACPKCLGGKGRPTAAGYVVVDQAGDAESELSSVGGMTPGRLGKATAAHTQGVG